MIKIILNGENQKINAGQNLESILSTVKNLPDTFAIAVNERFIPKTSYHDIKIYEGDNIELLVPMQGG